MSGSQKALKIISILVIVFAVLAILLGAVFFAAMTDPSFTSTTTDIEGTMWTGGEMAAVVGGFLVIAGVVDLIVGILGLRGAKNPAKIGAFYVIAWIGLVINAIELILTFVSMAQGTADASTLTSSFINLAFMVVCVWLARNIKQAA